MSIAPGREFDPGPAATIIPPGRTYAGFGAAVGARAYDASPDGSRFLMIKNLDEGARPSFVVVQNWLAEVADRLSPR